jgi:outer membrane protein assembly factor BamB
MNKRALASTSGFLPVIALLSLPAAAALAQEAAPWPQWLGPARNGRSPATSVFPRSGPVHLELAWRRALGVGTAGLAVAGDRLLTLESDGARAVAVALSTADGSVLWRVPLDEGLPDEERGPGSSPAVKDGHAYVLSPACQLRALQLGSGRVIWHVDLKARFGAAPRLGCQSSPLLEGDRLIVQPAAPENHRLVALDRRTGELAWSAKWAARATYSSPGVREVGGERHILVNHADVGNPQAPRGGITVVRAADGKVLAEATLDRYWSWATPVPIEGHGVLLLTWNDAAALQVPAAAGAATPVLWRSGAFTAYVGAPVFHDGHFYGHGGDFLRCVRASDGKTVWEEKTYPGAVTLVDGHVVASSVTAGLLRVIEATPSAYRERARLPVLTPGSRSETPPSVAGRRIFLRNDEEVVAVDVKG